MRQENEKRQQKVRRRQEANGQAQRGDEREMKVKGEAKEMEKIREEVK